MSEKLVFQNYLVAFLALPFLGAEPQKYGLQAADDFA